MKSTAFKIYLSCFCCICLAFQQYALGNTDPTVENATESKTIFKTLNTTDILTVNVKMAIDSLMINKKTLKSFPAEISYVDIHGLRVTRNIKVSPRGRSRRKVCDFPPLKIKFSKKELTASGLRTAHKSLKLVTHCNDAKGALQNVMEEYLAYKVYNELTNNSLKVQLVKINYEDIHSKEHFKRYAILIEDIDELAERLGGKEVEGFNKKMTEFDTPLMNTFAMFQFMIGNEDWRIAYMRNIKFIEKEGQEKLMPVPYDFDASGLVAANYAIPDRDLKLKSVQQRAFMGAFKSKAERAATVALFNAKKADIYKVIEDFKPLNQIAKARTIAYFDAFYEIINTPRLLRMAMPLKGRNAIPTGINGVY